MILVLLLCFQLLSRTVVCIDFRYVKNIVEQNLWLTTKIEDADEDCSTVQDNPELDNREIHIAVEKHMQDPDACEEIYGEIEYWDTHAVTNMRELFAWYNNTWTFNSDLTCWNVSSVTDMTYMFAYATDFNGNVDNWDTSNVTYTTGMFRYATEFNRPISDWNIEGAFDAWGMFYGAQSFDQELCWDVSEVYETYNMFYNSSGCIKPSCCEGCDKELLCSNDFKEKLFSYLSFTEN